MNAAIFQDIASCSQYLSRRFGAMSHPEGADDTFLRIVGTHSDYTELYPTKWQLSQFTICTVGYKVAQWLRHYAINKKIAGSKPDELIKFYQFAYSFQPHYALEIVQPLTVMKNRERHKCFWGLEHGRCVRPISSPPSVNQLPGQCGILKISQSYVPPRPVTWIGFFHYLNLSDLNHSKYILKYVARLIPVFSS
jgi:hypothetical protein